MRRIIFTLLTFLVVLTACDITKNSPEANNMMSEKGLSGLKISSPAFQDNTMMPRKYSCQGSDINPPLRITGIPDGTESLALIVDDPDAPMGVWDHWLVWNMPLIDTIEEDSVPGSAIQGVNGFGDNKYGGPCPPSGTHRYFFKLYALDTTLDLEEGATKRSLEEAMEGHIIGNAQLIGLYRKM